MIGYELWILCAQWYMLAPDTAGVPRTGTSSHQPFMTFKEHTMSATSSSVARVPLIDHTAATGTVRAVLDQVHVLISAQF